MMVLRIVRDALIVIVLYGVCAVFFPHELGGVFSWVRHTWASLIAFFSDGVRSKGPGQ